MKKEICPRCGRPISWIESRRVGNREYVYAIHYSRGKRDQCYLGPKGDYVHVTTTHRREGLVPKGLSDPNRVSEYFERLLKLILTDQKLKDEVKRRYGVLVKKLIE